MGHIYKPKYTDKKTGEVKESKVYWIKYYRAGKPYRESTKSKKLREAKRLLKKLEGEISDGKVPEIYFDKVLFDELAEDFLTDYKVNQKKSFSRAQISVEHLKKEFEGVKVVNITTPRIRGYIEDRMKMSCKECEEKFESGKVCPCCGSKKLSPGVVNSTINRELSALKRMFNLGANQTPPKVDRIPHIPMLAENNTRKGFFEHDEYLALKDALPSYLEGFVTFGYKTGWRVSEIAGLTWDQVNMAQGIVRIETGETKNDEARTVYLDDELKRVFRNQWKLGVKIKPQLHFVSLNGKGTDRVKRFDKAWKSACKKAGIGLRLFHDLRRTAVRNMVRAGIPEAIAMMRSGHKTRSVFDRYNIVNDADCQLASDRLEKYLESQTVKVSGKVEENDKKQVLLTP